MVLRDAAVVVEQTIGAQEEPCAQIAREVFTPQLLAQAVILAAVLE